MSVSKIKRVYGRLLNADGVRALVDRRTWFDHRQDRFTEFKTCYVAKLRGNSAVEELLARSDGKRTTLIYGAKDSAVNHAVVLPQFLAKLPVKHAKS